MTEVTSILLLQSDAEARLLADGEIVIQAMFPEREIRLDRAWMLPPDWLLPSNRGGGSAKAVDGVLPLEDARELLDQPYRLVIFSPFSAVSVPALKHKDGALMLAHKGLMAEWSAQEKAAVAAEWSEQPLLSVTEVMSALEGRIAELQERGVNVAVCTAFRHVSPDHAAHTAATLRENIRRMNLAIADLSRRTGCFVLDLDRPLAQIGGAALQADCFGGGEKAAEIALDELAAVVLDAIPDDLMPLEVS